MVYLFMGAFVLFFTYVATHSGRLKKQKKICIWLSILIPVFVAAFRYDNGSDYLMYARIYREFRVYGRIVTNNVKDLEVGFVFLLRVLARLNAHELVMYFITSLIIVTFYMKGIWNISTDKMLSVLLFFIMGVYFDSFNGIRQFIATAICFYAIRFINEDNFKKYAITVLVGTLFHYTAVIMIPIFFVVKRRFKLWQTIAILIGVYIGGNILFTLVRYLLSYTRYNYFLTSAEFEVVPTAAAILYTLIISTISIYQVYISNLGLITDKQNMLFNFSVLACASALLSNSIPLASRVQEYFIPVLILWIPELVSLGRTKIVRQLLYIFIVIIFRLFRHHCG